MISLIVVFLVIPLILFFISKFYFRFLEKLHSVGSASSKIQMFILWLVVCLVIFLSVYVPIELLKKEAPSSDIKLGVLPLIVGVACILFFQKNEIKRVGALLNAKK